MRNEISTSLKLDVLATGGYIERYHTKRVNYRQNVGEHSHRVAWLIALVHPECSSGVLKSALFHDISELATGDVPSPVKWDNPVLKQELNRITTEYEDRYGLRPELTAEDAGLLRWADLTEGRMFCVEEMGMGNRNVMSSFQAYSGALEKHKVHPNTEIADRQFEVNGYIGDRGWRIINNWRA